MKTLDSQVNNNNIKIKEAVIDGDSMAIAFQGDIDITKKKMDLKFLLAPLKTVDRAVKMAPVVGHILGGNLVSIPVKVTGDLANPKTAVLPPSEVGAELVGIFQRAMDMPMDFLRYAIP